MCWPCVHAIKKDVTFTDGASVGLQTVVQYIPKEVRFHLTQRKSQAVLTTTEHISLRNESNHHFSLKAIRNGKRIHCCFEKLDFL